jgi:hypothetical protein
MMIMRPPQHGQRLIGGSSTSVASALAVILWHREQLASASDVVGTRGFGEQAVMADAVSAFRQLTIGEIQSYQS